MQEIENFWRFYACLRKMVCVDREELKKALVRQYTGGRTEHLREMRRAEYDALCARLERETGHRDELRKRRSVCLRLMQRMGVDTSDWSRVDALCMDRRISGKRFCRLTLDDLAALEKKLRAIGRRGGLRKSVPPPSLPQRGAREGRVEGERISVFCTFDMGGGAEC